MASTTPPAYGKPLSVDTKGNLITPDTPIIPYIEGDGTGPDIWKASVHVFDRAVEKVSGGKRRIAWLPLQAGETSFKGLGTWLPQETLDAIRTYRVAIKGPLTTPVGGGIRSLNVTLRQELDLYQCVRPVKWFKNVPSPVKHPERVNMCIFRENTEDIYMGIEYKAGTPENEKLRQFFRTELKKDLRENVGLGLKVVSEFGSKRLVRAAIRYAIEHKLPTVTLMHKGNIMKYTEGAFREWGYEVAKEEFPDICVSAEECNYVAPAGKVMVRDVIADNMFQQALLRPEEYHVVACTNLNGDYLSDALAAQVGGLGIAPGGNIGDGYALFEATHGTAPKYAGLDKVNPGSVILSGCMMFEYLGWPEVSACIQKAYEATLADKIVTYDFARFLEGAKEVSCSAFAQAIVERL